VADRVGILSRNEPQVIESKEEIFKVSGRGEWIRTTDLLVPNLIGVNSEKCLKSGAYKQLNLKDVFVAC